MARVQDRHAVGISWGARRRGSEPWSPWQAPSDAKKGVAVVMGQWTPSQRTSGMLPRDWSPKMVSKFFGRRFPALQARLSEHWKQTCVAPHGHPGVLRWCLSPQERLQIQSSCQNPLGVPLMRHKWSCQQAVCRCLPQSQQVPEQSDVWFWSTVRTMPAVLCLNWI